jgi:hypothetical protein
MTDNAVFQGCYSDFKVIKTRRVAQVVIEIPLEQADSFLDIFRLPKADNEAWVAIAMLDRKMVESGESEATKAIQISGMLCRNPRFGRFLREEKGFNDIDPENPDHIANGLRALLGIKSRTEMRDNPQIITAFNRLKSEFDKSLNAI